MENCKKKELRLSRPTELSIHIKRLVTPTLCPLDIAMFTFCIINENENKIDSNKMDLCGIYNLNQG